jgi:hypothetical protein
MVNYEKMITDMIKICKDQGIEPRGMYIGHTVSQNVSSKFIADTGLKVSYGMPDNICMDFIVLYSSESPLSQNRIISNAPEEFAAPIIYDVNKPIPKLVLPKED